MGVQEETHDYINPGIDWLRIFGEPFITAQPSIMRAVNHSPGHFDAILREDFNIMSFYEAYGMGYKSLWFRDEMSWEKMVFSLFPKPEAPWAWYKAA